MLPDARSAHKRPMGEHEDTAGTGAEGARGLFLRARCLSEVRTLPLDVGTKFGEQGLAL